MKQKDQLWWVSATVMSLAAFSFFAGLGIRGVYGQVGRVRRAADEGLYPRLASAAPGVPNADLRPAQVYLDVLNKLELYYVEELPDKNVQALGSVEAMLNELKDPGSRLVGHNEMAALRGASTGELPGLGALLTIRRTAPAKPLDAPEAEGDRMRSSAAGVRTVTVVSVAPGSPAEKAGLQPGDRITEVDGRWIAPIHVSYRLLTQLTDDLGVQDGPPREKDELPPPPNETPAEREKARKEAEEARARWRSSTDLAHALELLNGAEPEEHALTIERGRPAKTIKVKVTFAPTRFEVFSTKELGGGAGYLRILSLNSGTPGTVSGALASLAKHRVKNLVVDLRGSMGGSIDAAQDVAGLLMGDVKFAVLKERDEERKLINRSVVVKGAKPPLKASSISVLVDGGTTGASELLAAALREQGGAKLVGTTTFGDGTEQELIRIENGAGVSITRARMLTSKGVDFDGKGLQPDLAPGVDPVATAVRALASPARRGS